jgi:cysteinyl-tRNA synthetase
MKLYNSFSRKKEEFKPIDTENNHVKIYACGITPYDAPHLGHILSSIRWNVLRNYLDFKGYKVTFVQNVTDIDDKIINRSKELNIEPLSLSKKHNEEFISLSAKYGIRPPDHQPMVSQYIPNIQSYINTLINRKAAYTTKKGDVYFDVTFLKDYGCLSGRKIDEMEEGTRGSIREEKRHPLDFALWKNFEDSPGTFSSSWGKGRPGWHIECSVMANEILGKHIDIHCGGIDLIFPHHENELAQCKAHNHSEFVNYWFHTGLLMINGTKMSKSLNNFITAEEALDSYGAGLIIYTSLKFHYSSPINLSDDLFLENVNHFVDLAWVYSSLEEKIAEATVMHTFSGSPLDDSTESTLFSEFKKAMDNDLNTPVALVVLSKLVKDIKGFLKTIKTKESLQEAEISKLLHLRKDLVTICSILFLNKDNFTYQKVGLEVLKFVTSKIAADKKSDLPPLSLDSLHEFIEARKQAREKKDFKTSDALRDKMKEYGIEFLDGDEKGWRFG